MDAVLDDVAAATGGEVAVAGRLVGGVNAGAVRVELAGGAPAVLKATPRTHGDKLGETQRARRVVEHMRECGYPTPAWFAVGATDRYVWHLMEFVDARPASTLTPSLIHGRPRVGSPTGPDRGPHPPQHTLRPPDPHSA